MPGLGRQTILKVGALLFAWAAVLCLFAGALGYISASSKPRPAFMMALNDDSVPVEVARLDSRSEPVAKPSLATAPEPSEDSPSEIEVTAVEPTPAAEEPATEPESEAPEVAIEEPATEEAPAEEPAVETAAATEAAEPEPQSLTLSIATTGLSEETAPAVAQTTPTGQAAEPAPALQQPAEAEVVDMSKPAWQRYGESADTATGLPRIAIVIAGLGLSSASSEAAIRQLPSTVTLSFTPYSRRLKHWISLARANDHEVLLDLPMEPTSFPNDDPGPYALLTSLSEEENQERLDWVLGRGEAVVGVAASMGSRYTASDSHMMTVVNTMVERGLLYLDNRSTSRSVAELLSRHYGMVYVAANRILDSDQASRIAINARLAEVERLAIENGFAVAIGQPYPVTIERVRDWSAGLAGRGFALVPITALVGAGRPTQLSAEQ